MLPAVSTNPPGFRAIVALLIVLSIAVLLIAPVSAGTGVTIAAGGDRSYYQGEEVILSGTNYDSDSTYLFMVGPNLPEGGGKLTSPFQNSVSGDPGSFTIVKTKPDKTWEYTWYTGNPYVDAGSYTVYAVNQPKTKDQLPGVSSANVSIILKKPFITAGLSSSSVPRGQPLTIKGTAEGDPESVQIWILGNNFYSRASEPVNPDVSYKYEVPREVTSQLPVGRYFVFVQHPMQNNRFDIDVSGDYVRSLQLNNGTTLFRISGPGSLQGKDAAGALVAAFSDPGTGDDTYIEIPFQVTDAGSVPVSGAPTDTGVSIAAQGDQSYYLGEKVVFSGHNYDSDTTYLFITGPGTFMNGPGIPSSGGKLTSPRQEVISGNPDSFTIVKTKPDKTWEYVYYTANLPVDAGTYTIYAASQPKQKNQLGPGAANVGIILKKPFITAEISPAVISGGQPFTVFGVAEGNPETVQIWILGKNYYSKSKIPVNPDASFRYVAPQEVTSHLAGGQYFVIIQHPMANTTFDIDGNGDFVRSLLRSNGPDLFRISGPGNLQGSDAAEALIAAFSDPKNGDDTYTEILFQVTDAGSSTPQAQPATTAPVQSSTQTALLPLALTGAFVLVLGIIVWKRH